MIEEHHQIALEVGMETPLLPDLPPEACIAIQPAYFLYQAVGQQVLIQGLRQKTGEGLVNPCLTPGIISLAKTAR